MNYGLHLLVYLGIFAISAISFNILVGYCGRLSLAHAGFSAVGSYAYALASLTLHWSFWPSVAMAMLIGGIGSFAISLPALRFKGDFFILITITLQVLLFTALQNWFDSSSPVGSLKNLTNGSFGIGGISRPAFLGLRFEALLPMAVLSLSLALIVLIVVATLLNSPWGRMLKAIRDDELAAQSLGKDPRVALIVACALSCMSIAIAGALYVSYVGYIDPSSASLDQSVLILSMVVVGGGGNSRGPIVGAMLMLAIPETLRFAHFPDPVASNLRLLLLGVFLVVLMHIRPQGIAGEYKFE